jgi:hypothetical protein
MAWRTGTAKASLFLHTVAIELKLLPAPWRTVKRGQKSQKEKRAKFYRGATIITTAKNLTATGLQCARLQDRFLKLCR